MSATSGTAADIAVAGAGIGGLAAALALAETGAGVTVYEQADALEPVGAGVQLSPNAALVLRRLGVLDAVRERATEPSEVLIRRGRDGVALARVPLAAAEARYGAPFLVALRADLQAALLARAVAQPTVTLVLGQGVTGYERTANGVLLRFRPDGPPPAPHGALVAADGIRSAIRRQMAGGAADDVAASGRTAWRTLVPRAAADADALVERSNLWLGPHAHLVHYPVGAGAVVNVVAIVDDGTAPDDPDAWSMPGAAPDLERRFAGWASPALRLIAGAPGWRKWPLFDRPPLARWCDGPVALLGDAAHPMLPFLAQGAAQAIEDAAALAEGVARAPGDLAGAMAAYAATRRPRTARVQAESRRQARVYHLAPPASLMRDFVLSRLGPDRLVARFDWLYDAPSDVRRFAAR